MFRHTFQFAIAVLASIFSAAGAYCQSSDTLALSSAPVAPGGTVALALTLTSPATKQPAGLQWTVRYSTYAVTAVTATTGSAATAAGKSVLCAGTPGVYTCLVSGLNNNAISNGVVAMINISVAATTTTATIGITGALGTTASGKSIAVTATGGIVTVTPLTVSALVCAPNTIVSGGSSSCTVSLNETTAPLGASVTLSSSSSVLGVPPAVNVAGGASSAVFTATAGTNPTGQSITVTASLNGSSQTAAIIVVAKLMISSLACNPSSVISKGSTTCTIAMNRTVYSSYVTVQLSTSNPLVTIPSSAPVQVGSSSASFTAKVGVIPLAETATIRAAVNGGVVSTLLSLLPPLSQGPQISLSCNDSAVVAGVTFHCSIHSSKPVSTGLDVSLSTSDAQMIVPSSVQVPAGSDTTEFAVKTQPNDHDRHAVILAQSSAGIQRYIITLLALKPVAVACTPHNPRTGTRFSCDVQLNAPIPEPVALAVSSSRGVSVPATLVTRPEQSSLTFVALAQPSAGGSTASVQVRFGSQMAQDRRFVPPMAHQSDVSPRHILARVGKPISLVLKDPQAQAIPLAGAGLPAGATFDSATARLAWTPDRSQLGVHDLMFAAANPPGAGGGQHLRITVDSGQPVATALVNAASGSPDLVCSPGSRASLQGRWLTDSELPHVFVNGVSAPVVMSTATRVDFLCPQDAAGTELQVWLENESGKTNSFATSLRDLAPAIFSAGGSTQGAIFFDNSLLAAERSPAVVSQPAQPGDDIFIRATGIDPHSAITATIDEVEVPVETVQPVNDLPGVYNIGVKVPAGAAPGEAVPVAIRVCGSAGPCSASNVVTMAIELPRP